MDKEILLTKDFFKDQELNYAFDNLTKVLNREMIVSYMQYLIDNKKPFSVCLCDVDNFKNVNDNYGHLVGDVVLVKLSEKLVDVVGNEGVVGRYGGDEFMIILEGITEYNDVWRICHNINLALPQIVFDNIEELSITITNGISRFPQDGKNYEEILSTADKALYRGKMKGRNCFIIYVAAKHANILLKSNNDSTLSSMDLINQVMNIIMCDKPLKDNIKALIKYFSSSIMMEHICIETEGNMYFSTVHSLSKVKSFNYIPVDEYRNHMNSSGIVYINNRKTVLQVGSVKFHKELMASKVMSTMAVSIQCHNKFYGIIRADSANIARIWQAGEMDLFLIAAKLIGFILYKNNLELDEILK